MTKVERIKAALAGQAVDRVPLNLWMHFSAADQDPRSLAETQVAYTQKYDFDFIKLMPFGLYGVQDYGARVKIFNQVNQPPIIEDYGIHSIEDWKNIAPLPAFYGSYGKQVQLAQYTKKLVKNSLPVVQTIFSPLTTARKLAGDRILFDMREDPAVFKQALEAITQTTINFVKANIDAGIDGFFFATQCANHDFISQDDYEVFGKYYDLKVIDAFKKVTYFNIAHMHGDNGMFEVIVQYPVNCINWHDRWSSPALAQARQLTDKCLLGGIREAPYYDEQGHKLKDSLLKCGTVSEIEQHVLEAIISVNGRGLILGPGCVADQSLPERNLYALRRAVYGYTASPFVKQAI